MKTSLKISDLVEAFKKENNLPSRDQKCAELNNILTILDYKIGRAHV